MAHFNVPQREERALSVVNGSKIDRALLGPTKSKKKHKIKKMRKPMVLPATLLEFMDDELRETAIRYLSNFLVEKREDDPDNYYRAGYMTFNSFGTMTILVQEILAFYRMMDEENLQIRSIKRLVNVLTIFQSVAANRETRQKFVDSCIPNFLFPLILHTSSVEAFDNVRAIALSIIGILCQGREASIIKWATESGAVEVCGSIIEIGSELTKTIAMHILESILQDSFGLSYVCNPTRDHLLKGLIGSWNQLVNLVDVQQDFSPRLLFHIIRCYIIICTNKRGYDVVVENLPQAIVDDSFQNVTEGFPLFRSLLDQLHMIMAK